MESVGINMNHVSAQLLVNFEEEPFFYVCKNKKMHELQDNDYDSDIFLDSVETDQK